MNSTTVIIGLIVAGVLFAIGRKIQTRFHAREYFAFSAGARRILGVCDPTTETGFIGNMSADIAERAAEGKTGAQITPNRHVPFHAPLNPEGFDNPFAMNWNVLDHVIIPQDIAQSHESTVDMMTLTLDTDRILNLLSIEEKRNISSGELAIIAEQYRARIHASTNADNAYFVDNDIVDYMRRQDQHENRSVRF